MLPQRSACLELKTARQSLLLSIDDAHQALNISKEYLEILEDPEKGVAALAKMIAPVYAHGYYRIYTQYLGIQQQSIAQTQPQQNVNITTNMVLRKPTAALKEDSAINKVILTVCALVVLVTILILSR
jgi:cytoskeletal protein RodZ